jgi:methyl-accepting chemotaxis protein
VAEEVRNLAAKSAAAAAETAEMIEDSIKKVEICSDIANYTAKALEEITTVVKESESIVTEIAEASNYQATAIAQIDRAIEQVSQVVQTNSATSEECAAASVELSNQASRMRDLISIYRLGDDTGMYMEKTSSMGRRYASSDNEQIISLGDGFGKY